MPITVGLGLSTMDRSLFSLRKSDRSLTTPSPLGGDLLTKDHELFALPELPPLTVSHSNNSFANLLDQLDKTCSSRAHIDLSPISSAQSTPVAELATRASTSSETLQQHNASSPPAAASMDNSTAEMYFSTLRNSSSSAIPERQQSSTSTTSYSKRSDLSSKYSASSRSSVDDLPEKELVSCLDPIPVSPLETDFLANGFEDVKLDLELNQQCVTGSPTLSFNVHKPLPPAPAQTNRVSDTFFQGIALPELDSNPVVKNVMVNNVRKSDMFVTQNDRANSMPSMRQPETVPSTTGYRFPMEPPRRNSARLRSQKLEAKKTYTNKFSADMAEPIVLAVLCSLGSLQDLQATAMVNKGFYRIFKLRETEIVESVLRNASQPAWELRQLVKKELKRNPFQMKAIQRDFSALRALQAFMLMQCNKVCRKSTIQGLTGEDKQRRNEIEDALWRIWIFCKQFGKGTSRDVGPHAQAMWLEGQRMSEQGEGSARYTRNGDLAVPTSALEDMSEMWRCMEMLLGGFRGRELEAREAGIFDQCKIDTQTDRTESQFLEDWIYDVLSVGPKAVLTMISCSFEHAKVLGVTKWTPPREGKGRRSFLKAALEQVYRDRLVEEARTKAESFAKSMQQHVLGDRSMSETDLSSRAAMKPTSTILRSTSERQSLHFDGDIATTNPTRPLEIRPDCDPEVSLPDQFNDIPVTSPATNPAAFTSMSMLMKASARLGATLFPHENGSHTRAQTPPRTTSTPDPEISHDEYTEVKVVDPTDRAMSVLIKQLGFPEHLARQALAMSDDGAGIDLQRAVELLSHDRRLESSKLEPEIAELPAVVTKPSGGIQQFKDYCEGTCRRVSLLNRRKSNLRGLISRNSLRHSFPLAAIMDREDEDKAIPSLAKSAIGPSITTLMPTILEVSTNAKFGLRSPDCATSSNSAQAQYTTIHESSSSNGYMDSPNMSTADSQDGFMHDLLSPVSPMTPVLSLGGFSAIKPASQTIYEKDHVQQIPIGTRPKLTLTRVGTGKRPGKGLSFRHGLRTKGEPPEIIGFTY